MTYRFILDIDINQPLTQDQVEQLGINISDSLLHTCDTAGLSPEDSEGFTEKIVVMREDGRLISENLL